MSSNDNYEEVSESCDHHSQELCESFIDQINIYTKPFSSEKKWAEVFLIVLMALKKTHYNFFMSALTDRKDLSKDEKKILISKSLDLLDIKDIILNLVDKGILDKRELND